MPISSAFTVDGAALSGAMEVEYAASVAVALVDTTGVHQVAWSIVGSSSSGLTDPTFADAAATSTTYPQVADPGTGHGASFGIKCLVTDSAGNTDATIATVGTKNEASVVPAFSGEETERDSTHGWTAMANKAIADNVDQALSVLTTDATPTTVLSQALADDTIYDCGCRVVTHETAGVTYHSLVRHWTFGYQRVNGGAPTKIVADSDGGVPAHIDDATWAAVVDLNGNTMRIRITNDATNNCTSRAQLWLAIRSIAR